MLELFRRGVPPDMDILYGKLEGAWECTSSKCESNSWRSLKVVSQHFKLFQKLASILGRYEEEWKDGD